jgi:hypothetical protein
MNLRTHLFNFGGEWPMRAIASQTIAAFISTGIRSTVILPLTFVSGYEFPPGLMSTECRTLNLPKSQIFHLLHMFIAINVERMMFIQLANIRHQSF